MRWWQSIVEWWPWSSRRRDDDIDREIAAHLALEAQEQAEAGLGTADARNAARRAFGNTTIVKEDARAVWASRPVERLAQDLRYAVRTLRRSPAFAVVTLGILALGIGANTTIFSIVNGVLLRPLPFHEPDRLMMLDEKWLPRFPHFEASPQDFVDWQAQSRAFSELSAFVDVAFNLTGDERPERIEGARVSANLPSLLGVQPIHGRSFRPEEDVAGNNRVVLLGHGLWQRAFGGQPNAIGRAISLNGVSFTIVGVMPPEFRFPRDTELWMPMGFTAEELESRGNHFIWAIGRLKPGITREQAQAEMDLIMPRLQKVWSANVIPLMDYYVGDIRRPLIVLLGAAGLVLLIVCVNVASLLLARASVRQRELSLRAALGASRGRLVQQLFTETMLLALLGGLLGVALAFVAIRAIRALPLTGIPRFDQTSLDYPVLLFALVVATLTGVLFGMSPALRLSRTDLHEALKASGRTTASGTPMRARNALVVAELALALVLLAGAGLLLKSFWRLLEVRPGFNSESVLSATINLPAVRYDRPYLQTQFIDRLVERIGALPEVRAVAASSGLPFSSVTDAGIRIDGRPEDTPLAGTAANYYRVTHQYVQVMNIPLKRGRFFTKRDVSGSPPVAIINDTMARVLFPDEDPIGKHIDVSGPTYLREIIGVVGDVKQEGLRRPIPAQVYEPFLQKPSTSFYVVVRGVGDHTGLEAAIRRELSAIDKELPLAQVRPMTQILAGAMTRDRVSAVLLSLFAALALGLAAVGIYGVIAYAVTQRTQEIGIRMALGATRGGIVRLVLTHSVRLVLAGLALGLAAALALTRVLGSLLYEVTPRDPLTLAAVSVLLLAVALTAALIPARRAAGVDPIVALRSD